MYLNFLYSERERLKQAGDRSLLQVVNSAIQAVNAWVSGGFCIDEMNWNADRIPLIITEIYNMERRSCRESPTAVRARREVYARYLYSRINNHPTG